MVMRLVRDINLRFVEIVDGLSGLFGAEVSFGQAHLRLMYSLISKDNRAGTTGRLIQS